MPPAQKRAKNQTDSEPLSPVRKRSKGQPSDTLGIESTTVVKHGLTEALSNLAIPSQSTPPTLSANADIIQARASVATAKASHEAGPQIKPTTSTSSGILAASSKNLQQALSKPQTKTDHSIEPPPTPIERACSDNEVANNMKSHMEDSSLSGWSPLARLTLVEDFSEYPVKTPFPDQETDLSLMTGLAYLWEEHCLGKENRAPLLDDYVPQPWLRDLDMQEIHAKQSEQPTRNGSGPNQAWYKEPSASAKRTKHIFEQIQEWLVREAIVLAESGSDFIEEVIPKTVLQGDPHEENLNQILGFTGVENPGAKPYTVTGMGKLDESKRKEACDLIREHMPELDIDKFTDDTFRSLLKFVKDGDPCAHPETHF